MTEFWWRAYDNCVDHAKLILLNDRAHRAWFNLMCVASAHDGILPDIKIVAVKLRITPARAAAVIAELVTAGLFDRREDGSYEPHNWGRRQFKTDAKDPSGAARSKKYRDNKKRDASRDEKRDASRDAPVSEKRPHFTLHTDDDADDARARSRAGALSSPEALALTEKLLVIAGHDPSFWPPGWCGAPARVQLWLAEGWPPAIILAAVEAAAKRKPGAPASSVNYFEKAIAEEIARQAAPLPAVIIKPQETIHVHENRRDRSATLSEIAMRDAAAGIEFGPRPTGLRQPESGPPVRLLSEG